MTTKDDGGRPLHPLVALARQAVEAYVQDRRVISPARERTKEMQERAGVFVCLKKDGELRGCIGTFEPLEENVGLEIVRNAINAATRDPRFSPVRPDELPTLVYTVDILTKPEPIGSQAELDCQKYGVIVEAGRRRGLLLPDLDGVDTVEDQIAIASRKAGIRPGEPISLLRFAVQRYE